MIKNICCIGAGYVGGPTMSVIAEKCPDIKVTLVDSNPEKIDAWNGPLDSLPVYEPGLKEIVQKVRGKNLFFSNDIDKHIDESEMIFIAVNTPTKTEGEGAGMAADLKYVIASAKQIAKSSNSDKIVIEKSTLPVRTAEKIKEILSNEGKKGVKFEILSNPEFLAEGTAIQDLYKSDRVLIGGDETQSGKEAVKKLIEIYCRWIPKSKIITTNVWSSELAKLASNAMLAQRISSINSLSAICEKTGAKIDEIAKVVGSDNRIGNKFLKVSVGFGGSCFKKDILNLVYLSYYYGLNEVGDYWKSVIDINNYQIERFAYKIVNDFDHKNQNNFVSILGWSFKKNTNDSRESSSIYISSILLKQGIKIKVYDPKVHPKKILQDLKNQIKKDNVNYKEFLKNIIICDNIDKSLVESQSLAICTEWDEFINYNWNNYKGKIYDGRSILKSEITHFSLGSTYDK